jgi:hypothetical protein
MTKTEQYQTPIPPEQVSAAETDTLWRRRTYLYGNVRGGSDEERAISRELKARGWDVVTLPDEPAGDIAGGPESVECGVCGAIVTDARQVDEDWVCAACAEVVS